MCLVGVRDNESVEQLRERLRRLEATLDATGLGLWEWDVRSGELSWNDRNRELLGVDHAGALTIQDFAAMVHPDDLELLRTAYLEAAARPDGGDLLFEYRTKPGPDGKSRWLQQRCRVLKDAAGVHRVVGATLDVTDRKTAEERRGLVLSELAHRSRNGILLLMSLVAQTAREATSVKDLERVLMARLQALADCQDLLTQAGGRSLLLGDLLDRGLSPFDVARFSVGPDVREISVSGGMVVSLALLIHELATNAVKYGALSAASGSVSLRRTKAPERYAHLEWVETGGPAVSPPTRRGFGSRLLDISLRNDDGRVEPRFEPQGFRADIHFPLGPG